jgi:hypothetical protein
MILTSLRPVQLAARATALLIMAIATPTIAADAPASDIDGLVRVDSRNLDHVYVLPAADFGSYMRIRLDPVEVSFSERWDPTSNRARSRSGRRTMSADEIERLRSTVATEFDQIFRAELRRGGYMLIQGNADDALRVTPMIVNLYVTAPSAGQQPGTRIYTANTGHMTLVAEVSDSVTGEPLARVMDTRQGRRTGTMQLASAVSNMADARRVFTDWARTLRAGLDDARQSPVAKEGLKEAAKEPEAQPR